jgi:UDP-3-O-[3-hydroxymyristoyl] glucosamine N-acyltransferase
MKMNNIISFNDFFEFIEHSDGVREVIGKQFFSAASNFGICPADAVPEDGRDYVVFVGRTARDPIALFGKTTASLIVVDAAIELAPKPSVCIVRVDNPRLFFCELLAAVAATAKTGISELASIHPSAVIGEGTSIGKFVSIGERVVIGSNCSIADNVTILSDIKIGDRVNLAPGVVIGVDGFGYERREDGSLIKFPHIGDICIGDDVDIGGNTVIDRGALGSTIIESGVKIDNLVHISHNVHIEADCVVIANAMVAGGVKVGKGSWVGPSSNILDRTSVGANSFVGMGVSVIKDLSEGSRFTLKNFLKLFS